MISKMASLLTRLDNLPPATANALVSGLATELDVAEANACKGEKWRTQSASTHYAHVLGHVHNCAALGTGPRGYVHRLEVGTGGDGLPHIAHAKIRISLLLAQQSAGAV